ncbi:MAG: multicopper oxidase domain-containing protein, partial [Hyphomicrobiales bacterium]
MNIARRDVLKSIAGAAAAVALPIDSYRHEVSAGQTPIVLKARKGEVPLARGLDGAGDTEIWGYDGSVPGPTIRCRRGEPVHVRLVNQLGEPTTIHWHGLRIDNAMDGVVGLTQDAVEPGGSFDYVFTPPDAGSFWYHT